MPDALAVLLVVLAFVAIGAETYFERRNSAAEEARYDTMKRARERGEL